MLEQQIWNETKKEELKIYFYFDTDNLIIYPEERAGFDKIFGRLHIYNKLTSGGFFNTGDAESSFFSAYTIKSQKDKCAVLLSPLKITNFIEDLKTLIGKSLLAPNCALITKCLISDLGLDGSFKLTQQAKESKKIQYIEITGNQNLHAGAVFRSYVEIETIFSTQFYPEVLEKKEIEFVIDQNTCTQVFAKFNQRL